MAVNKVEKRHRVLCGPGQIEKRTRSYVQMALPSPCEKMIIEKCEIACKGGVVSRKTVISSAVEG